MFSVLLSKCYEKGCALSIRENGEFNFVGNCENCLFKHEKIIAFGDEIRNLQFEEFVSFINKLKTHQYYVVDKKDMFSVVLMPVRKGFNQDDFFRKHAIILVLQFCIEKNIFKDYCIKKLKKELNERFELCIATK